MYARRYALNCAGFLLQHYLYNCSFCLLRKRNNFVSKTQYDHRFAVRTTEIVLLHKINGEKKTSVRVILPCVCHYSVKRLRAFLVLIGSSSRVSSWITLIQTGNSVPNQTLRPWEFLTVSLTHFRGGWFREFLLGRFSCLRNATVRALVRSKARLMAEFASKFMKIVGSTWQRYHSHRNSVIKMIHTQNILEDHAPFPDNNKKVLQRFHILVWHLGAAELKLCPNWRKHHVVLRLLL